MINILQKISTIEDLVKKKLYFMGLLTEEAKKENLLPIVVGGTAVDFYTDGIYQSYDIDIISDRRIIGKILENIFGFIPNGRHWINNQLGLSVEVPSNHLAGDKDKITTIKVRNSVVYTIGIEDLIIDRLNACVHWKSQTDCNQAQFMIRHYKNRLDFNYLENKARQEGILKIFRKMYDT